MLQPKKSNPVQKYKKTIFVDPSTSEGKLRYEAFQDSLVLNTMKADPEAWFNNKIRAQEMKINPYLKNKNILLDPERIKRALANKPIGTKKIKVETGGNSVLHRVQTINGKKVSDKVLNTTKNADRYKNVNVYAKPQEEVKFLKPKVQPIRKNLIPLEDLNLALPEFTNFAKIEAPILQNNPIIEVPKEEIVEPISKGFKNQYYNTNPARGEVEKPGITKGVRYIPVSNSVELKMWEQQKLAFGTNQEGIMKTKMNPRKKYANGTNTQGVGPNNYIQSPNEVLSDYSIMLAEADKQVASNSVVPIVSLVGGLLQQGVSMAGSLKKTPATPPVTPPTTAANGMNNVKSNVEVEGGEMYETPQGETGEFQGPSHEQGGIPLEVGEDVEEGTKIYSDRLKVGKETLAERKEARERKIANLEKVASQPLIDAALKNATQRKMMAIQKEEAADLAFQEQVNNMQAMADTMVKAFGTSMAGLQNNPIGDSMRYGSGTGAMGVTEYGNGGVIDPIYGNEENKIKNFQSFLGVKPDGVLGKKSQAAWDDYLRKTYQFKKSNYFFPGEDKKDLTNFGEAEWYPKMGLTPGGRQFKESIGLTPAGIVPGPTSEELLQKSIQDSDMDIDQDGIRDGLANNPSINLDALKNFKIGEGINDNASLDYGNPYAKDGVNFEMPTETIMTPADQYGTGVDTGITPEVNPEGTMFSRGLEKGLGAVGKMGGMPSVGDLTSLFGDYLGATSGLKNAAESRSTDITHTNVYKDAGKESQKQLDNAMSSIEGSKAQAIVKATTNTQGSKRSGRNYARGVNQMRGMDWLYDTALNEQIASISANAAAQTADIYKSKSGVAMTADQLKGEGQYKANMANEAAKDAYYTAKGLALKDQANAIKQGGKDINAIKRNKIIEKLMKNYGTYGQVDVNTGEITNKPIPGQTQQVFTLNGQKYTTDSAGNLKLV